MDKVAWESYVHGFMAVMLVVAAIAAVFVFALWGFPRWGVYNARLSGEGELRRAEFSRRVAVVTAEAERDAASARKQAAITRAEGIAEANHIIGKSITPQYIQWLWVEGLIEGKNSVIYVPTEANLPILEAMRMKAAQEVKP